MRYINGAEYIALADGSLTSPSLTFLSDPDTGFYRVSPNVIAMVVGGVAQYFIVQE